MEIAYKSVKKDGGHIILIGNAPEGHVSHYLFGSWGNARPHSNAQPVPPAQVQHLYILTEYPDLTILGHYTDPERVSIVTNWPDILSFLKKSYPGHARVAVYPNADIQYSEHPALV